MGNKKGISSEDFFGRREEKSEEVKQKYNQLAGQKAISSDMFFGNGQNGRRSGGKDLGDEVEGYLMGRSSQTSKYSYYREVIVCRQQQLRRVQGAGSQDSREGLRERKNTQEQSTRLALHLLPAVRKKEINSNTAVEIKVRQTAPVD